jgi:hypothetical protein
MILELILKIVLIIIVCFTLLYFITLMFGDLALGFCFTILIILVIAIIKKHFEIK